MAPKPKKQGYMMGIMPHPSFDKYAGMDVLKENRGEVCIMS
jgi:hypothetical protein